LPPTFTKDETLRNNYTRYQQQADCCLRNQTTSSSSREKVKLPVQLPLDAWISAM